MASAPQVVVTPPEAQLKPCILCGEMISNFEAHKATCIAVTMYEDPDTIS
jgi:hypothetical protein